MKHVAATLLCLATATAHAEPTKDELAARKVELDKKLAGKGYTVVIQAPFVIVDDENAAMVKRNANFMKWTTDLIEADFFPKRPAKLIEVWLFKNEQTYRKGAKQFFNDEPDTPYGYYSTAADALIMNVGPGLGTLSHELVHPYMEANFANVPSWFNEGLASLYEQPRERAGADKKLHMWGTPNWRLPNLKAEIRAKTLPSLKTLMSTTRDGFYNAQFDAYAYARFLLQYLQDHGKLHEFYDAFHADAKDLTGQTALAKVVGEDLESFEAEWRTWVLALKR